MRGRKLVAGMLAACAINSAGCDIFPNKAPMASSPLVGEYQCYFEPKSTGGKSISPARIPSNKLKIAEVNGSLMLSGTDDSDMVRIQPEGNRFTYTIDFPGGSHVDGSGVLENGTLRVKTTRTSQSRTFAMEYVCGDQPVQPSPVPPPQITGTRRGVFIRPCESQFYQSFGDFGKQAVTVSGGTLRSACNDMAESGVTDIFVAFKADHEGKGCGNQGDLLFDSKHNGNENQQFSKSRINGFDPILELLVACDSAFQKAGKTVNLHAWVPVFKDRHAASIKGMRAIEDTWFFPKEYRSDIFADPTDAAVVEYQLSVIAEIVKYASRIDGINLDYIRYEEQAGAKSGYRWDVNVSAITDFVSKVRSQHPGLILSADVFNNPVSRVLEIGQDGVAGQVDILIPMEYSYFGAGMGGSEAVGNLTLANRSLTIGRMLMPALRGWNIGDPRSKGLGEDLRLDILAAKGAGADGYALFTYEQLIKDTKSSLVNLKANTGY
ncbi:MAG: putative glycoside hydrolase [Candidatus Micrarchaeota archaeon]